MRPGERISVRHALGVESAVLVSISGPDRARGERPRGSVRFSDRTRLPVYYDEAVGEWVAIGVAPRSGRSAIWRAS